MMISVLLVSFLLFQVQSQDTCKRPYVEQRLLADDVRYASPFYVIALPKTPETQEMDNVCYTYFDKDGGGFFHIMSITFKNGTNKYYEFSKEDISDRMGIAQATSDECVFHDYTLKPICNVTVFILYRCYIQGKCSSNIDIGAVPGVDVRVTLAASPKVSTECQAEAGSSLGDTTALAGGDYILLPQKLTPNCITKYNNMVSIGDKRALGPKTVVSSDLNNRFAENQPSAPSPKPVATPTSQGQSNFFRQGVPPPSAFNPYGRPANGASAPYPASGHGGQTYSSGGSYAYVTQNSGGYGASHSAGGGAAAGPGQTHVPMWPPNNVQKNPQPWNGQTAVPGAETHHHIWQSAATAAALKTIAGKNPNVYYHIHSWEQPAGCCKCL